MTDAVIRSMSVGVGPLTFAVLLGLTAPGGDGGLEEVEERRQREGPRRSEEEQYDELRDRHVIIDMGDSIYFSTM